MSPNGRRAWREWMRKANPRRKLRPPTHSICRLAREGRRHIGPIPPETPKPFTPRSLVGMTQGARKRAIRRVLRSEMPSCYRIPGAFYRIGQKLRPCPGCSTCARPCHYCEMQEPDDSRCPRCRQVMYSTPICDGSGVLPARKENQ